MWLWSIGLIGASAALAGLHMHANVSALEGGAVADIRSSTDRDVYERQGFGAGLGEISRPALLIIDFVNGFADPAVFGGGNISQAIANTAPLLAAARRAPIPVAFSRIVYPPGTPPTAFQRKIPALQGLTEGSHQIEVVCDLSPRPGELVVDKQAASIFFGTSIMPWLIGHRVESLLIAGCTTSGCVRASVVDGMSWNYKCFVVGDCSGDRSDSGHHNSLFEMSQKYADVIGSSAAIRALESLTVGE